jgi:four helix bundle protein
MYKDFTDMPVWHLSMEVAEIIFGMTKGLPTKEDYGLTSQIRRASVSISANIAEAFGRSTPADKNKFYDYSRGSAFETKSLLLYGKNVGYFTEEDSQMVIEKLSGIIHDLNKVKLALSSQYISKPKVQAQSESQPQS